jgi:hypothetical protein
LLHVYGHIIQARNSSTLVSDGITDESPANTTMISVEQNSEAIVNTHFSQYTYIYFVIIITTCFGPSMWPSSGEVQNFEVKNAQGK